MTEVGAKRPLVAIVVVGYNDVGVVCECLRSLQQLDYRPTQVIYVDNDSADGSLEAVRAGFPEVTAVASGGNLGYCGGNNVGISRALDLGAAFVLILNPDTVVCNPTFVTDLVDYMTAHPKVGKVGPKVYLRRFGVVQNTILTWPTITGSFLSVLGNLLPWNRIPQSESVRVPTLVQSLNGCCLLVRTEALRDVGPYDESFWGYVDELDWDWQAEQAGWQRHYLPVESIVHMQKAEGYDFASRTNYYIKRNTARWYAKAGKWFSMSAWMAITLVIAVIRAAGAPLLGRSPLEYFHFVGKLSIGYAEVVSDLINGKLRRSRSLAL